MFGNPRDIIYMAKYSYKNWEKSQTFVEEKDAIWIIFYENVYPTLTSDHRKDFYNNVKTCDMTAKCMLHVTCCWSIEKKNWGPVNIYHRGGGVGNGGMEEDLRGNQRAKSFQEEQKEDQMSPTKYRVGDYWKLTASEPPLKRDFIATQTKSSSPQGINNTGPLRKMSLFRAGLRNNFNSKESGKVIN